MFATRSLLLKTNASEANVDAFATRHNDMKYLLNDIPTKYHRVNFGLISDPRQWANPRVVGTLYAGNAASVKTEPNIHMTKNKKSLLAAIIAFWLCIFVCATAAQAGDPDLLSVSLGAFDTFDNETAVEGRVEYRSDKKLWNFKPFSGFMATSDKALYGYLGVLIDFYFGHRLVITPSFAPGAWSRGDGKDLGHWIEFRSQVEFAYRLDDRSRIALSISHMSNAGLDSTNPGEESLVLTYAVPFSTLLGP